MTGRRGTTLALILACASSAGCTYLGSARDFDAAAWDEDPGWLAVRDVPLVRQKAEKDCGAAALSMVLGSWGSPAPIAEIWGGCAPTADGLRAGDLRDFARRRGLKAFLFQGRFEDLERELSRRRPVLVGLVKPHLTGDLTHYEVVVGLHRERRRIVTLDPDQGWRVNTFDGFEAEWKPAGRVTMVVFKPEEGGAP